MKPTLSSTAAFACTAVLVMALCTAPFCAAGTPSPALQAIQADLDAGRLVQADRAMARVLAAQPDSAPVRYLSARLLAAEGKWPLARAELLRAEHLDPAMAFVPPRELMDFAQAVQRHTQAGPLQSSSRGVLLMAAAFILVFLYLVVGMIRARRHGGVKPGEPSKSRDA